MTGDRKDNPQSSEEVGNCVCKQRGQMILPDETLKKTQNKSSKSSYTKEKKFTGKDYEIRCRCLLEASGKRTA